MPNSYEQRMKNLKSWTERTKKWRDKSLDKLAVSHSLEDLLPKRKPSMFPPKPLLRQLESLIIDEWVSDRQLITELGLSDVEELVELLRKLRAEGVKISFQLRGDHVHYKGTYIIAGFDHFSG